MLESIDRDLLLFLNGWGTEGWDRIWLIVTDKTHWIPLYLVLVYHCYLEFGWKKTLYILVAAALLVAAADQTANLFKSGFARPRPCHLMELESLLRQVKPSCGGKFGFFSAHAANSMAVAVYLGLLFRPRVRAYLWILLGWSVMVGYSRIYLGVHYPGDVLTGFAIGGILGWLAYRLVNFVWRRWNLS